MIREHLDGMINSGLYYAGYRLINMATDVLAGEIRSEMYFQNRKKFQVKWDWLCNDNNLLVIHYE